ncbi:hypothetical protein ES332_D06G180800v1 [Gossypium tomentosum]|uniref:Uncharacterized protein n=1 Tax=Gossypium tomentosum TaxID=34277 RepID=A0A5D2KKX4_GOSTO|nr:hypothetical protein ES332_D06G180800v1 [Gossypium tomentosum]
MEAALCLAYGPLPSISLRTVPASTRLHFGFNPSFLLVSSGFITNHRQCRRFYGPGPLALDRSNSSMASANENGGAKVVRGAVGASLALACALGIIGCGCKMNFKAIAGPKPVYRKAPSFEHIAPPAPRKMALKSLLDVTVNLASKEGRRARDSPGSQIPGPRPSSPSKDQIDQLKKEAVSLMKRGLPEEALYMLKNEYKKYEMSEPEAAYYMNMVLVEILISQGKYEEAYEFMTSPDQKVSELDVRPTLYKAIICTMLDKDDEAQRLWDDFAGSVGGFFPHGF